MTVAKEWYKSKTVVAVVGLILLLLNRQFGIVVSETEIFSLLYTGTELVFGIVALYGRITATTTIK